MDVAHTPDVADNAHPGDVVLAHTVSAVAVAADTEDPELAHTPLADDNTPHVETEGPLVAEDPHQQLPEHTSSPEPVQHYTTSGPVHTAVVVGVDLYSVLVREHNTPVVDQDSLLLALLNAVVPVHPPIVAPCEDLLRDTAALKAIWAFDPLKVIWV